MALSLLNTNEVQVARLVKALYNAAPGYTFMTNFSGYAAAKGMNGLAEGLVADFASNSNATLAAAVAANVGLTGSALTAATAYLQGQFEFFGAAKRGQVILDAVNGLSNLTKDATYGAAATAFNDSVATAVTYSSSSSNNSTDLATLQAAAVPTGSTVALVSGTDNVTGTTLADTFTGTLNSTLTSVDKVNGGAGNDILKATLSTSTDTVQPVAITDVETIRVTGVTAGTNNTLSVKYATGLTLLEFNDITTTSAATHTITDITSPTIPLQVKTVTADTTTVNFTHAAAGLTGTTDTVALTLEDVGTSTTKVAAVQVNTAGIEGLTVTSNGSGNYLSSLTATSDLKTLTINGSAPLTVTTLTGTGTKLTTINASAATGKISIDAATAASNLSITGGSANDTFTFGSTLDVNDTVDGGAGTNTVSVSASVATNVTLTNIQALTLTGGADQDLSQANLANIATVSANPGTGATTELTNATPGKHTLTYTGSTDSSAMTYALKSTLNTTTDSLTVTVGSGSSDGTDRGDFTATNIETLNLTSASKTATTANTIGLVATSAQQVNLSGTALTIDSTDFSSEVTIDASAMTGSLSIVSEASTDETIIGGSANDSITFTSTHLDAYDSINGGAGNDTVTILTNGAAAAAYGRVSITNVENLVATLDIDAGTSSTHTIDLRNAPLTTVKVTTADGVGAGNANTDSITISNLQSGLTKFTLDAAVSSTGGTYTLDSDRLASTNFVFKGGANKSVTGLTLALTGDWTGINLKQTDSASTATEIFASISAPTSLTSLSIDSSEHATTITSLTASKLASLTITGDNATTLTSLSQTTAALANVDGSAASGNITLTATTRTAAATVKTGVGDDSIELTLTTEGGNTIDAGTNSTVASASTGDTLVLNGRSTALTEIDLSSTTDQIVTINGVANAATQIGFEHVDASGSTVVGGTYSIVGSSGINVITGDSGADTIDGAGGNDTITGNGGNDVLTGGSGNDVFDFNSVSLDGSDTITDFTTGYDSLDFDGILDGVTKAYQEVSSVAGNFTASNVIVIGGTTTIAAAATAIALDADVVATAGLIVFSDGIDTFIYHSDDLDGNGTETLLVTLAGITDPTTLVTADFVFA